MSWKNGPCSFQFSSDEIVEVRSSCSSLTREELDMAILGQIMALSNVSEITYDKNNKCVQRQKKYTKYFHNGYRICPITFRFLHTIGEKRLKNLIHHFKENGLTPRVHGNMKSSPKHALSFSSIEHVVQFLVNYADQNAILLPGRVPGYRNTDLKLLPSSVSKRGIWKVYKESAESTYHIHLVAYTTFCRLWVTLLPSIILIKPMSDPVGHARKTVRRSCELQICLTQTRVLQFRLHKSISLWFNWRGRTIKPHVMLVDSKFMIISLKMARLNHHHLIQTYCLTPKTSVCITCLTTLNKFIFRPIHSSQALYSS